MGKIFSLEFDSSLDKLCEANHSFDKGVLRICYTGRNRNGSYISKGAMERSLQTIYNCPVVCNYHRDEDRLGGHDVEVVRRDGEEPHLANVTEPIGVVPESAKVWFENLEDSDGVTREYLLAEVLLWKRQEAYSKVKRDGISAQSMEITVQDGLDTDGVFRINAFEFNAFCLLGDCQPCYEGAALETFSLDKFEEQMEQMMRDYKEAFSLVMTPNGDDDTHPKFSTEGGEGELEDEKVLSDEAEVPESEESEVEEVPEEQADEADPVETEIASESESSETEEFALTDTLLEEICRALETERIPTEYGERPHYSYADSDFDAGMVYAWDICDWLLYGFPYTQSGDSITIDFAGKKRMKYVITDYEGAEQPSPFEETYSILNEKVRDAVEIQAQYQSATEELEQLRRFKADTESAAVEAERQNLFAQFEDLNGIEAFENLKEARAEYSLEALEEKCYAIRGRNGNAAKFSYEGGSTKLPVEHEQEVYEPYGGLFQKYSINN